MSSGYFGQSDQMEHRDLGREMSNIGKSSEPILGLINSQAQAEGDNQLEMGRKFRDLSLETYPMLSAAERTATRSQRKADLTDLGDFGARYCAQIGQISPGWEHALGA